MNIELVQEYVKEMVYIGAKISPYTQVKLFSEQLDREYKILLSDPDIKVVTDSPISLAIPYAVKYGFQQTAQLFEIYKAFDRDFPSLNILLKRDDCPYKEEGRIENLEEAKEMDQKIERFMIENEIEYESYRYNDHEGILDYIREEM